MKSFPKPVFLALAILLVGYLSFAERPYPSRPNADRCNPRSAKCDDEKRSGLCLQRSCRQWNWPRAIDSASIVQVEGALLVATVEGVTDNKTVFSGATANQVAMQIAEHAAERFSPPGCVSPSVTGATAVLTFNDCTGPRGLRQLTGQLVETVSVNGALYIDTTASGLQIGQMTMDIHSTSTINVSAASRSMSVNTIAQGTGPLGNTVTRDGNYTVTWDSNCITTDGTWSITRGEGSLWVRTTALTRCDQQCPRGTISRAHGDQTMTITFDGTAVAKWSTNETGMPSSGTINLTCTP